MQDQVTKLYVIATPLGHKDDITRRAITVLEQLSCLVAEDTRELRKLLSLHGISASGKRFLSMAQHNMKQATEKALSVLESGECVGLVTDRGTPAISDPGHLLVSQAHARNIGVVPVPGPSSVTACLSASGWDLQGFYFAGFLPKKEKQRQELFEKLEVLGVPFVVFESPKRIQATLKALQARFLTGRVFIGREMTKKFEQFETIELKELDLSQVVERGEYTLVVHPGQSTVPADQALELEIELRLSSDKKWSQQVATRLGCSAKQAYDALQREKN